jgi:DNA-binding NtrC family response regulator
MYRLVAYAHGGLQRYALSSGDVLVGSGPDCDLVLDQRGVAPRHARIRADGNELRIEDVSRGKGVLVNGRRVLTAPLQVLDEVRLGDVTLLVEDVRDDESAASSSAPTAGRQGVGITPAAFIEHLARLSHWVLADSESRTTLESQARRLLVDCGGGVLFLFLLGEGETDASVRFALATAPELLQDGEELLAAVWADRRQAGRRDGAVIPRLASAAGSPEAAPALVGYRFVNAVERRYLLVAGFPGWAGGEFRPVAGLGVLADLLILGLVHHVGRYEPILPGARARRSLVLPPGLVLGESAAMHRVVELLTAAIEPPINVLLRGERGSGEEQLARLLHLSGAHREGPFVVAQAAGADAQRVAADLLGAEVAGRSGPLHREGKLAMAHGGTLFLTDVDRLPSEVQARLVRVLRSGEVERLGGALGQRVDVRIVATSSIPLESLVAGDRFRPDLAQLLGQVAVDVPPLRARREDLPLLIQSYLNRFCHEAGKRVQGVSVRAMAAMVGYDYPGNLLELENLVRQLVTLCPAGQPIDTHLLPVRMTAAESRLAPRLDAGSDLDLARLVATAEESAIREALRRSRGNKAQAARWLGLSRNGLAMKMGRLGLAAD